MMYGNFLQESNRKSNTNKKINDKTIAKEIEDFTKKTSARIKIKHLFIQLFCNFK